MVNIINLAEKIESRFGNKIDELKIDVNELTIEIPFHHIREVCYSLRNEQDFQFELLMDLCGVDYLTYGVDEWEKEETSLTGFSRGVEPIHANLKWQKNRFAVVYHLLSLTLNHRIRLRTFPEGDPPIVDSVIEVWNSANWYEREAFDLYGILFKGHPDLRRILTDYGFIGYPFRKDFPLIGNMEMRYDAGLERCIYEPVSIRPRTLVPKVIRQDNRYLHEGEGEVNG